MLQSRGSHHLKNKGVSWHSVPSKLDCLVRVTHPTPPLAPVNFPRSSVCQIIIFTCLVGSWRWKQRNPWTIFNISINSRKLSIASKAKTNLLIKIAGLLLKLWLFSKDIWPPTLGRLSNWPSFLPSALQSGFPEPGCLPLSCKSPRKTLSVPFPTQLISQLQDFKRHALFKFDVFYTWHIHKCVQCTLPMLARGCGET